MEECAILTQKAIAGLNDRQALIGLILAEAGELDFGSQKLTEIHVLKYAYLADVVAATHGSLPPSGTHWRFYKFGPYDEDMLFSIEPTARLLEAQLEETRWSTEESGKYSFLLRNNDLRDQLRKRFPLRVRLEVTRLVKQFTNNTQALLDYTYKTTPMLHAKPHQALDLTAAQDMEPEGLNSGSNDSSDEIESIPHLTKSERAQRDARRAALKERAKRRALQLEQQAAAQPLGGILYPDAFRELVAILDADGRSAGGPRNPDEVVTMRIHVDDSAWSDPARCQFGKRSYE